VRKDKRVQAEKDAIKDSAARAGVMPCAQCVRRDAAAAIARRCRRHLSRRRHDSRCRRTPLPPCQMPLVTPLFTLLPPPRQRHYATAECCRKIYVLYYAYSAAKYAAAAAPCRASVPDASADVDARLRVERGTCRARYDADSCAAFRQLRCHTLRRLPSALLLLRRHMRCCAPCAALRAER